jgi:hypothetical protein
MMKFSPPEVVPNISKTHSAAASGNAMVAEEAAKALSEVLNAEVLYERLLLRAAAGAGKSYVLKRLVSEAAGNSNVARIAVAAFQNKQILPLARDLGKALGKEKVCLFLAKGKNEDLSQEILDSVFVTTDLNEIPASAEVIVGTIHKLKSYNLTAYSNALGPTVSGDYPFDVLFVDEAWQVAHHLFDSIKKFAPLVVGVGDVGQLPPLEVGDNPWRGDQGFNPYRAWPTEFEEGGERTWVRELPAVWRPTSPQLALWQAFYPEWDELNCVAGPGDRQIVIGDMSELAKTIWNQVATGIPTLLEVDGLPSADDPDVDFELVGVVESLLDELFQGGFALSASEMNEAGDPSGITTESSPKANAGDPLVAVLATRNQTVDDATDAVERIKHKYHLDPNDLVSSTVDSWQGQTNGITVAIHPLSGAFELDEFNSAFGRLAVTCTRATHGLLLVTRPGLDDLLRDAPARPGTPLNEPGFRTLPRQTHSRILLTFARGTVTWTKPEEIN